MEEKEQSSIVNILQAFTKKNLIFIVLILLGLALIIFGLFQYFNQKNEDIQFVSGQNVEGEQVSNSKISVDVEGSVQKPGVYNLPEGARLQDALIAAGGLNSTADREYVSKSLNLAQKLTDAAKIYIPKTGEKSAPNLSAGISSGSNISNLININAASASELDKLPKVGVVTAEKIINGRPYTQISELVSKKVLTQQTFEGLKEMIVAE